MSTVSRHSGPLLATLLSACAQRPLSPSGQPIPDDCEAPIEAADEELVTVAVVADLSPGPRIMWSDDLGTVPVEAGHAYAVVDSDGYVGTLIATKRYFEISLSPTVHEDFPDWWSAVWTDPPRREWGNIPSLSRRFPAAIAFGRANARYASAQLVVPERVTGLDANNVPVPPRPSSDTRTWTRLVAITTASEPSAIEVWGHRCGNVYTHTGADVRELRITERGRTRIVQRSVFFDRTTD